MSGGKGGGGVTAMLTSIAYGRHTDRVPKGMEASEPSQEKRNPHPIAIAVFLRPRHEFMAGRAAVIQYPQGEICPLGLFPSSEPPGHQSARVRTLFLVSFQRQKRAFIMTISSKNSPVVSAETISLISHASQPVVTTDLLAKLYGTQADNIKKNFSRNQDRFVEGKHYFKLEGEALRQFKGMGTSSHHADFRYAARLILWTERGAARHAKMLETDQAWDVFEKLEDCYFTKRPSEQLSLTDGQHFVVAKDGVVVYHKPLTERTSRRYLQPRVIQQLPAPECQQALKLLDQLQSAPAMTGDVDYRQVQDALRRLLALLGRVEPYRRVAPAIVTLEAADRLLTRLWTMIDESRFRISMVQNNAAAGQPLTEGSLHTIQNIRHILGLPMTVRLHCQG